MKNTRSLVLGFISTVLLAVGFTRTADKLDPIAFREPESLGKLAAPTPSCVGECHLVDEYS